MKLLRDLFSPHGRLSRGEYWFGTGVIAALVVVSRLAVETIAPDTGASWLPVAAGVWCLACATTKRLRDAGRNVRAVGIFLAAIALYAAGAAVRGGSTKGIRLSPGEPLTEIVGGLLILGGAAILGVFWIALMLSPTVKEGAAPEGSVS